jgi:hypothetical protein
MLRFERIVLAPCPFCLISGAFEAQVPLALQGFGLRLQRLEGRERSCKLIGLQRRMQQSFDLTLEAQRTHGLAAWAVIRVPVDVAFIDRVLAVGAGVAQSPPSATAATNDDTVQQRLALPGYAGGVGLIAMLVVA